VAEPAIILFGSYCVAARAQSVLRIPICRDVLVRESYLCVFALLLAALEFPVFAWFALDESPPHPAAKSVSARLASSAASLILFILDLL
jgi:hypothetical protein